MKESEQPFFWQWVATTGVGWLLFELFQASFWLGLMWIMVMASGQWLLLRRRHVEKAGWWIAATPVGLVIGIVIGGITGGRLQDSLDGIVDPRFGIHSPHAPGRHVVTFLAATALAGACVGGAVAAAQWRVLRRQAAHEWCWLAVNTVSFSLAAVTSVLFLVRYIVSSVGSSVIVGVGSGLVVIHCLSAGRHGARVAHDTRTSERKVADVAPEDSAAPPPSDWLARSIGTLWPSAGSADRWLAYYPICLAAIGLMAIAVGMSVLLRPALGTLSGGMLVLALGALYLVVSIGLIRRRLWAWRVNYWGLLLVQPITLAGVLGLWPVERFPLLTAWRGGMMLFLGLWSVLNMRYFQKRRHRFVLGNPSDRH